MSASQKRMYIYPLPLRIWHWLNAACFVVLIFTGLQIRYAEIFHALTLPAAIAVHNYVGFAVIVNFFIWLTYNLVSGQVKSYIPDRRNFLALIGAQLHYYGYGIFVGKPNPHSESSDYRFNPLQQLVYLGIMFILLPAQMMSGLFLWQIKQYEEYINLLGGIKLLDTIHVLLCFFFISFLVVHSYLATLGPAPCYRIKSMFSGYAEHFD